MTNRGRRVVCLFAIVLLASLLPANTMAMEDYGPGVGTLSKSRCESNQDSSDRCPRIVLPDPRIEECRIIFDLDAHGRQRICP